MTEREREDEGLPPDDALSELEARVLWKKLVKPAPDAITRERRIDAFFGMATTVAPGVQPDAIEASVRELLPPDVGVGDNRETEAAFARLSRRWCFRR